jgi:hypothetical protein
MVQTTIPKAVPGDTTSIAARYERARQIQEEKERKAAAGGGSSGKDIGNGTGSGTGKEKQKSPIAILNEIKRDRFGNEVWWVLGVLVWFL